MIFETKETSTVNESMLVLVSFSEGERDEGEIKTQKINSTLEIKFLKEELKNCLKKTSVHILINDDADRCLN